MANTAFTHDPTITVPSSSTANGVVLWNGTTGKNFDNANHQYLLFDGNSLDVKNNGTASSVKLYCESSKSARASGVVVSQVKCEAEFLCLATLEVAHKDDLITLNSADGAVLTRIEHE